MRDRSAGFAYGVLVSAYVSRRWRVRTPTVYEGMTDSFLHTGSTLTHTVNDCPCTDHKGTTGVTRLPVTLHRGRSDLLQSPMGWRVCVFLWERGPAMALAGDRFYAVYGAIPCGCPALRLSATYVITMSICPVAFHHTLQQARPSVMRIISQ